MAPGEPIAQAREPSAPTAGAPAPAAASLAAPFTAFTIDVSHTNISYVSTYTTPPDTLEATYDGNRLNFARPGSVTSYVALSAPLGQPLAPGSYVDAVPSWQRTAGVPGIDTNLCSGSPGGSFTVSEASYAPDNTVVAFAATYYIRCDAFQDVWGELRYASSVGFTSIDFDHANNLRFWGQQLGSTSSPDDMPISNPGSDPLTLGSLELVGSPDFTLVADTCSGATIGPGAACSVSVTYSPSTFEPALASLTWTDNTARGSHAASVAGDPVVTVNVTKPGTGDGTVTGTGLDCGATCTIQVDAAASPPAINLATAASIGSVFTGWGGACSGRESCTITFSEVTPTVNVSATFAPAIGGGSPAIQARNGFEAYRDGEAGCPFVPCFEPPDPAVGASPTQVMTANNARMRVTDRLGTVLADLPIWRFFAESEFDAFDQEYGGDPRVVWDAVHGRWLASEMSASCTQGHLYVGISVTADATGDWLIYRWDAPAGAFADFPILGLSSDKVLLGYNAYFLSECTPTSFQSGALLIAPLAPILAGASVPAQTIVRSQLFGFAPAVDPTRANATVLGLDQSSDVLTDPQIVYLDLAGPAGSAAFGPKVVLPGSVGAGDPPTPAAFPAATDPPMDGRVIEASVQGGILRFATTVPCTPTGDTAVRACARVGTVGLSPGFAAWMDEAQSVSPGVNTSATAVAAIVTQNAAAFSFRLNGTPPYGLSGYGANGTINYGAKGAEGPKMFDLPCPAATETCSPDGKVWTGTLTASDFQPSAQVPTYAIAIAAMQSGLAYVQLFSGTAPTIRGQLGPGMVIADRYQESVIGWVGSDTFLPAVGGSLDGTTYLTYSRSTGAGPVSTSATWAAASDPRGTFRAAARLTTGGAVYVGTRWGDYATITPDPANPHAVWQAHEAVTGAGNWYAWTSQLVGGVASAPSGSISIDGGAQSTILTEVQVRLTPGSTSRATEALVSDSPTLSTSGLLAKARRLPLGTHRTWELIDASVGGTATAGTKTIYVQWGDGAGNWSTQLSSASITLIASDRVSRLAGPDRYATAAAISAKNFQPFAPVVFIATGLNFPDALAGAAAAGKIGAPILLVGATGIPTPTADELTRLKANRIVLLGGPGVIPEATRLALEAYATGGTSRIWGYSRYETAAYIAESYFAPGVPVAFVATGVNFPDALAGAAAAGKIGAPILLVSPTSIPDVTAYELEYLQPGMLVILGGTGAVSSGVQAQLAAFTTGTVTRLAGADRFATAARISASHFSPGVPVAFIATGLNFPDALAGAAVAGKLEGPVLLVTATSIPSATRAELMRLKPKRLVILGGTGAVSEAVRLQLGEYVAP